MKRIGDFLAMLRESAPIAFWAMLGGGIVASLIFSALVLIIWRGGWPAAMAPQQLQYLGWALLAQAAILALVMVRLTGASISGRFGGNEFDVRATAAETAAQVARQVAGQSQDGDDVRS